MLGYKYVERAPSRSRDRLGEYDTIRALGFIPNGVLEPYDDAKAQAAPRGYLHHASATLAERGEKAEQALLQAMLEHSIPITADNPETARKYRHFSKGVTQQGEASDMPQLPLSFGNMLNNNYTKNGICYRTFGHCLGEIALEPINGSYADSFTIDLNVYTPDQRRSFGARYYMYGGGFATASVAVAHPQSDHPAITDVWNRLELDELAPLPNIAYPDTKNPAMYSEGHTQIGPHQLRALGNYVKGLPQ